jgi:hypothetical protein
VRMRQRNIRPLRDKRQTLRGLSRLGRDKVRHGNKKPRFCGHKSALLGKARQRQRFRKKLLWRLQNLLPRFNSGRGLQHLRNWIPTLCSEYCEIPPEAFAQTVIVAKGGGSDVHSVSPARMGTDWVNRCCCRGGRPGIVPTSRTGTADFPRRHLYRCTMVGFPPRRVFRCR